MAKYSDFIYGTGVLYGERGKIALSAEPMSATAIDYGINQVSFIIPSGDYVGFKLVRNQDSFPETEDDGVVLVEKLPGIDSDIPTTIIDDTTNVKAPLILGRFAYYRAWILVTTDSSWVPAGDAYCLVPLSNGITVGADAVQSKYGGVNITSDEGIVHNFELSSTHRRFLDTLPRVLTSATNNPADEINDPNGVQDGENTVISQFLSAFSFSMDEAFTNIALINPDITGWSTNPNVLSLLAHEFGLEGNTSELTKTAKRLIREAPYIYKRKGTLAGLQTYVEALTGFNADITLGKNLILSYEDSTFLLPTWSDGVLDSVAADPVGAWYPSNSNITLSISSDKAVASGVTLKSLDSVYTCKAVVGATGTTMELGTNSPMFYGIPVTAGETYSLSAYLTRSASTANTYVRVVWYDKAGEYISQTASSNVSVGTSWTRVTKANQTAPEGAVYAGLVIAFGAAGTYYVDMVQFEKSATVTEYEEARAANVWLNPERSNKITNPSFENGTTNWVGVNTTSITDTVSVSSWSGTHVATIVANGSGEAGLNSELVVVTPEADYTASIYVKDFNTSKQFSGVITFFNVDGDQISQSVGPDVTVSSAHWTRVSISGTAPLTAVTAKFSVLSNGTPSSGTSAYFDAAMFSEGSIVTTYLDGSKDSRGCAWEGAAHDSLSFYYSNRDSKLTRLSATISNMLPLGTPYYIDCYGIQNVSGVFSGIS